MIRLTDLPDRAERWLARHRNAAMVFAAAIVWHVITGNDAVATYVGLALILFLIGEGRRDRLANQAKNDALIAAVPDADNKLMRAEARSEDEIEEMRL